MSTPHSVLRLGMSSLKQSRSGLACAVVAACMSAVSGCGGGSPAANATTPVTPSNLSGNWLIAGSLPSESSAPVTSLNLAMTFDVNGSNLTAAGFANIPCGSLEASAGFGALVSGPIAADGSFTAQTPFAASSAPLFQVAIQGTVPKQSGGPWSGTYTLTSSFTGCSKTLTGSFTATPIGAVSGTYAGSVTLTQTATGSPPTKTPVTMQVALKQGGTFAPVGSTTAVYSEVVLTGSIKVQGTTCFASGTASTTVPSAVEGNFVLANFDMDDGSKLQMLGTLLDVGAGKMSVAFVQVSAGGCGQLSSFPMTEFDRQS